MKIYRINLKRFKLGLNALTQSLYSTNINCSSRLVAIQNSLREFDLDYYLNWPFRSDLWLVYTFVFGNMPNSLGVHWPVALTGSTFNLDTTQKKYFCWPNEIFVDWEKKGLFFLGQMNLSLLIYGVDAQIQNTGVRTILLFASITLPVSESHKIALLSNSKHFFQILLILTDIYCF